jgi:hypothetical protein
MSTRALYTFKGETAEDTWNVYKHHDGYPTGAAATLKIAFDYFAWPLPRYESDTAAAAFCAAGKTESWFRDGRIDQETLRDYSPGGEYRAYTGGGVRLMPQGDALQVASAHCSNIEYRYEIYQGNDQTLRIAAYSVNAWDNPTEEKLFDCLLQAFCKQAKAWEKAQKEIEIN